MAKLEVSGETIRLCDEEQPCVIIITPSGYTGSYIKVYEDLEDLDVERISYDEAVKIIHRVDPGFILLPKPE